MCLLVVKGGNSRKDLALKKLEGGSSSSGDVGHVSGTSGLLAGGDRVSSSDDGGGSLLLGEVSKDVNDSKGSLLEGLEFEDSHGSVHDDGLAVREELLLLGGGVRTVVKSHPAVRDGISLDNLGFGLSIELIGNNNVGGEEDLLSELLGLLHDLLGGLNVVVLNKGGSNRESLGLKEGEDHSSSNDDLVALVKKGVKNSNLGRNLGSSNNGGHGLLSVLDGSIKVLKLLGEEVSGDRGLEELGHTLSGGVGAVGGTEGIVDEKVEGSGELLNVGGVVLLLLLVETGVLEHEDISLLGGINNSLNLVSDGVGAELDLLSEELSEALGAGSEGELVLRSVLGTSQVGADGDDGTLALQVLDGGDRGADTGIIGDGLSVKGNVDVATDEDLLSLKVGLREVLNGLLGIEGEVEGSGGSNSADTEGRSSRSEGSGGGEGEEGDGGVDELHG